MNSRERLKEYIENDQIYEEWLSGKLKNPSDFDKFCIQHCEDIESLLRESKPFCRHQENGIKSGKDTMQKYYKGMIDYDWKKSDALAELITTFECWAEEKYNTKADDAIDALSTIASEITKQNKS